MKRLLIVVFVCNFVFGAGREQFHSAKAALAKQVANQSVQLAFVESQQVINEVLNAESDELRRLRRELEEERAERHRHQAVMAQNERVAEKFNIKVSEENVRRALIENEEARLEKVQSGLRPETEWLSAELPSVEVRGNNRGWSYLNQEERAMVSAELRSMKQNAEREIGAYVDLSLRFCRQEEDEVRRREEELRQAQHNVEKQLRGYAAQLDEREQRLQPSEGRVQGSGRNLLGVAAGIVKDFLRRVR